MVRRIGIPRRPLGQLRDLPRGAGGSHRLAAMEKATPPHKLAQLAMAAQKKFPRLSIFRPSALWHWFKTYSQGVPQELAEFLVPTTSSIVPVGNNCTMAIAGDWGTGTDEAAIIAEHIRRKAADYTIHLGDVYYVGSREFIDENCRDQKQPNGYEPVKWPYGLVRTFAMNGNHEAYARDRAYFKWIQTDLKQPSSCFALYNDNWCVLGLDTGYNSEGIPWIGWLAEHLGWSWLMPSCKIPDPALNWLDTDCQSILTPQKGIVLLTHHQYYSSFDNEYPNAARQLSRVKGFGNRDLLWMWGHEHRFAGYDLYGTEGVRAFGRCLGHGGMPCDRGKPSKLDRGTRPLQFYDDRSYDPDTQDIVRSNARRDQTVFGINGYAVLQFEGATLKVSYRDIADDEVASEAWVNNKGIVAPKTTTKFGRTVELRGTRLVNASISSEHAAGR